MRRSHTGTGLGLFIVKSVVKGHKGTVAAESAGPDRGSTFHGVDLATGERRFEVATRGPVVASPTGLGDRFFVGSTDGDVYLLDTSGQVLQRSTVARTGIQS